MRKLILLLTMMVTVGAFAQRKGFKVIKRPDFKANALITVEQGAFNEKDKDLLMDYLFEYGVDVASDRFKTDDKIHYDIEGRGIAGNQTAKGTIGKIGGEKFKSAYVLTTKQARESVGHNALQVGLSAYTGINIKIHSKKVKNIDVQIIDAETGRLVCKISYYGKAIDKAYFYQRVAEELVKDGQGVNNAVQNISVRQDEVDILSETGTKRQQIRSKKRVSTDNN